MPMQKQIRGLKARARVLSHTAPPKCRKTGVWQEVLDGTHGTASALVYMPCLPRFRGAGSQPCSGTFESRYYCTRVATPTLCFQANTVLDTYQCMLVNSQLCDVVHPRFQRAIANKLKPTEVDPNDKSWKAFFTRARNAALAGINHDIHDEIADDADLTKVGGWWGGVPVGGVQGGVLGGGVQGGLGGGLPLVHSAGAAVSAGCTHRDSACCTTGVHSSTCSSTQRQSQQLARHATAPSPFCCQATVALGMCQSIRP